MKKALSVFLTVMLLISGISFANAKILPTAAETEILPVKQAEDLAGLEIPKEWFKFETTGGKVLTAEVKASETDSTVSYVEVNGIISPVDPAAPNIEWRVLLPLKWNGRTVQFGGGANNGSIPKIAGASTMGCIVPIDTGYVTYGGDSGHQAESAMDAEFAANEESLYNWLRGSIIKTYDAMQFVVKEFYGVEPVFCYWAGCSTGGREALEAATNFGSYYDGIFCSEPSSNFVLVRLWGAILSQTVYKTYDAEKYPHSDGFIPEDIIAAIQAEALERYDELDGIKDGIVSNMYAARMQRDMFLEYLSEKYSLTQAQLDTIDVYENGYTIDYEMVNGMNSYHGYAALEGGKMDLGPDEVPREPLDTAYNVHHGDRADGTFKYFITKDPNWVLIDHDYFKPDEKLYKQLMDTSLNYDANRPNFDEFIANNGKLIYFAGWDDMSMSPWQLIQQYRGYLDAYGQEKLDSFCKFYVMPGVTHGNGIQMDYLTWLDIWCSTGEYPSETLYAKMLRTGGEMPMAEFPGWVQYVDGDPMLGTSYKVNDEVPDGFWNVFD